MTIASQPDFTAKTLVVSDLVDSTGIVQRLGDREAAALFRSHDQTSRTLIARHRGREIDKSDGFLVLFDRATDAVNFALDYQEALRALATAEIEPTARVGVHFGDVILIPNEPAEIARGAKPVEVEGLAKPIAARLMALARGRQVLVSRRAYDQLGVREGSELRSDCEWVCHGEYLLKGVFEPVEVFEAGIPGFGPFIRPQVTAEAARLPVAERPSLLVLPLDDSASGAEVGCIGYGLGQEIVAGLSRVRGLRVMASSAAARCDDSTEAIERAGRETGAAYVLRGTTFSDGARLRVTAWLLNTKTAGRLWLETYESPRAALADVAEHLCKTILDALGVPSGVRALVRDDAKPPSNLQVFEYYVRARQEIVKFTADGLERALQYLDLGLEREPDSALLIATAGYAHWQHVNAGISTDPVHLARARECADRVFALQPGSVHGSRVLGLVEITAKNIVPGIRHLERVLSVEPNDPDALLWLSIVYGFVGRTAAAEPLVVRLLGIDPWTPFYQMLPGFLSLMAGDFARALPPFEASLRLDPSNPVIRMTYAQILAMSGDVKRALDVFDQLASSESPDLFARLATLYACSLRQQRAQARKCMTPELTEQAACDLSYSWNIAQCMALIGDADEAVEWLRRAVRQGFWNFKLLFKWDPFLQDLLGLPELESMLSEASQQVRTLAWTTAVDAS